jgi:uncharacterized membrane protein YdjX (TVP38/TMEM64 family)
MSTSAPVLLLAVISLFAAASSSPQFAYSIPNGNAFGVMTGHKSGSGGGKCAFSAQLRQFS